MESRGRLDALPAALASPPLHAGPPVMHAHAHWLRAVQRLEQYDGDDPRHAQARRGACVGFFQLLLANDARVPASEAAAVLDLLTAPQPQSVEDVHIADTLTKWAAAHDLL